MTRISMSQWQHVRHSGIFSERYFKRDDGTRDIIQQVLTYFVSWLAKHSKQTNTPGFMVDVET